MILTIKHLPVLVELEHCRLHSKPHNHQDSFQGNQPNLIYQYSHGDTTYRQDKESSEQQAQKETTSKPCFCIILFLG